MPKISPSYPYAHAFNARVNTDPLLNQNSSQEVLQPFTQPLTSSRRSPSEPDLPPAESALEAAQTVTPSQSNPMSPAHDSLIYTDHCINVAGDTYTSQAISVSASPIPAFPEACLEEDPEELLRKILADPSEAPAYEDSATPLFSSAAYTEALEQPSNNSQQTTIQPCMLISPAPTEGLDFTQDDDFTSNQEARAATPDSIQDQTPYVGREISSALTTHALTPRTLKRGHQQDSLYPAPPAVMGEPDDALRFQARSAISPAARLELQSDELPTLGEQEVEVARSRRNTAVAQWVNESLVAGNSGLLDLPAIPTKDRRRAKSVGAQPLSEANLGRLRDHIPEHHVPGPGLLLEVQSETESSDAEEEEASVPTADFEMMTIPTNTEGMNDVPGVAQPGKYDDIPGQPIHYRAKVWHDPLYDSSDPGIRMQPETVNKAIKLFEDRAREIEEMSRRGTWGTRRMSESDLTNAFNNVSLDDGDHGDHGGHGRHSGAEKKSRHRTNSFLARIIPKRAATLKRKESDRSRHQSPNSPPPAASFLEARSSSEQALGVPRPTRHSLMRMSSLGRKNSRPTTINTGSAIATIAGQMAAVGGHASVTRSTIPSPSTSTTWNQIKHSRSKSNECDLGQDGTIANMLAAQGGPPVPSLGHRRTESSEQQNADLDSDALGDDNLDDTEGQATKMDLSIQHHPMVPTLDGFRNNIRILNPRLDPHLLERFAQRQLARYRRLLEHKATHTKCVRSSKKCPSAEHCLGTEFDSAAYAECYVRLVKPKASSAAVNIPDGHIISPLFHSGVPAPPVPNLPNKFECPLCFQVKNIAKPSSWSKHVHEDVQPFTCTFPNCVETKSFGRKADWVRHENEVHRQLEWWQCTLDTCRHKCCRNHNFAQHLIREHKWQPKSKQNGTGKGHLRDTPKEGDPSGETDEFWVYVASCYHTTDQKPQDESCRFCGNICSSWKDLTSHLGKHLEQIVMPIIPLIRDTTITEQGGMNPHSLPQLDTHAPSDFSVYPHRGFQQSSAMMHNTGTHFNAFSPSTALYGLNNSATVYSGSTTGYNPTQVPQPQENIYPQSHTTDSNPLSPHSEPSIETSTSNHYLTATSSPLSLYPPKDPFSIHQQNQQLYFSHSNQDVNMTNQAEHSVRSPNLAFTHPYTTAATIPIPASTRTRPNTYAQSQLTQSGSRTYPTPHNQHPQHRSEDDNERGYIHAYRRATAAQQQHLSHQPQFQAATIRADPGPATDIDMGMQIDASELDNFAVWSGAEI